MSITSKVASLVTLVVGQDVATQSVVTEKY